MVKLSKTQSSRQSLQMKPNLLIVDDSLIIRSALRRAIEISNIAVESIREASDGYEALQLLESSPVDLVFSDINMPGMGGVELLREMEQRNLLEQTRVVIVSTQRSLKRIAEVLGLGASAYIPKPFTPEQIRDVIQREVP